MLSHVGYHRLRCCYDIAFREMTLSVKCFSLISFSSDLGLRVSLFCGNNSGCKEREWAVLSTC